MNYYIIFINFTLIIDRFIKINLISVSIVSCMFIIKIILIYNEIVKISKCVSYFLLFYVLCDLKLMYLICTMIDVRVDVMINILIRDYFPYFC